MDHPDKNKNFFEDFLRSSYGFFEEFFKEHHCNKLGFSYFYLKGYPGNNQGFFNDFFHGLYVNA